MEIDLSPRRSGKTTRLIRMSREYMEKGKKVPIVCFSNEALRVLKKTIEREGATVPEPILFSELPNLKDADGVLIDNLDCCVMEFSPVNVMAVTMSTDYGLKM